MLPALYVAMSFTLLTKSSFSKCLLLMLLLYWVTFWNSIGNYWYFYCSVCVLFLSTRRQRMEIRPWVTFQPIMRECERERVREFVHVHMWIACSFVVCAHHSKLWIALPWFLLHYSFCLCSCFLRVHNGLFEREEWSRLRSGFDLWGHMVMTLRVR